MSLFPAVDSISTEHSAAYLWNLQRLRGGIRAHARVEIAPLEQPVQAQGGYYLRYEKAASYNSIPI